MYTTKRTNKNLVDGNAYNTIGDPYKTAPVNPFRQGVKGEKLKHFESTQYPKNEDNGHFSKLIYHPDEYKDGNKYITTQPLDKRKNGFGTKDAHKRDEFSSYVRTEQYRETIKKEKVFTDRAALVFGATLTEQLAARAAQFQETLNGSNEANKTPRIKNSADLPDYSSKVSQYDIGRTRLNEFNPKTKKDSYYNFDENRDRRMTDKPCSCDIGAGAWSVKYAPPANGGRSSLKNFYDRSHLSNVGA